MTPEELKRLKSDYSDIIIRSRHGITTSPIVEEEKKYFTCDGHKVSSLEEVETYNSWYYENQKNKSAKKQTL